MKLFPVLDLWRTQVVRGVAGQRDSYAPLHSRLGCPPEPLAVARAIRQEYGCDTFYLADLDAIRNQQPNLSAYRELIADGFELWIDAGVSSVESARQILEVGAQRIIVGLESIPDPAALTAILAACGSERIVFSLDLQGGQPLTKSPGWSGLTPLEIGQLAIRAGVQQLIVLDLAQVGVGQGLSTLSLCAALRESTPNLTLVTGGGVRGPQDLQELASQGIYGVLVASALHDGRLNRDDVRPWL